MKPFTIIIVVLFGLIKIVPATNNNLNVVVTPELAERCSESIDALDGAKNSFKQQMDIAVCIHANKHYSVALEIYAHTEKSFPFHAYVHVNQAAAHLSLGQIGKARESMNKFFDAVGGIDGTRQPTDTVAVQNGSPCSSSSEFKVDCVNALNNFAALELTDGKNASAVTMYLHRAIEIASPHNEEMLGKVYANYGGQLSTIGEDDRAAEAFLKSFLINLRGSDFEAATAALVRRALIIPKVSRSAQEAEQTRINFTARIRDVIKLANDGEDLPK